MRKLLGEMYLIEKFNFEGYVHIKLTSSQIKETKVAKACS